MNRRKQFRAVATRFDKLAVRYQATIAVADIFIWLRARPDQPQRDPRNTPSRAPGLSLSPPPAARFPARKGDDGNPTEGDRLRLGPDVTLVDTVGPLRRRRLEEVAVPEIALFLYEGMTALDAVGPYEVLARLPDAQVTFVASTPGPKTTDVGLVLTADASLDAVSTPDIIVIPGSGKVPFLEDPAAVEWVRRAHETSRWTASVCTG
jgi:DJ-1/PfpI family